MSITILPTIDILKRRRIEQFIQLLKAPYKVYPTHFHETSIIIHNENNNTLEVYHDKDIKFNMKIERLGKSCEINIKYFER